MNRHIYVKRVILTASHENVQPIEVEIDRNYEDPEILLPQNAVYESRYKVESVTIQPFYLTDWTMTIETDFKSDYKKIVDIVGEEKALEVLAVLGKL